MGPVPAPREWPSSKTSYWLLLHIVIINGLPHAHLAGRQHTAPPGHIGPRPAAPPASHTGPAARHRPAAPPASRAPQASRAADQPHVWPHRLQATRKGWPHRPQATRKGWPYYIRLLLRPCEHLVYSRATPCGWPGARVWSAAREWPAARVAGGACGLRRVWPAARVAGGACGRWRVWPVARGWRPCRGPDLSAGLRWRPCRAYSSPRL